MSDFEVSIGPPVAQPHLNSRAAHRGYGRVKGVVAQLGNRGVSGVHLKASPVGIAFIARFVVVSESVCFTLNFASFFCHGERYRNQSQNPQMPQQASTFLIRIGTIQFKCNVSPAN